MDPYFSRKPYNLYAYKNEFGIFSNVNMANGFSFFLDIGYSNYFNVVYENFLYEDTPFFRFGFPVNFLRVDENNWFGFSFYMDRVFVAPKIGIFGQISKGMLLAEMGFYKAMNFAMSYRLMI